jgi:hypothetical protein
MVKNIVLGFASIALAVVSAANSYHVTFYQPVMIHGSELQPGDYKLELNGTTATIKQGKTEAQAPVTIQNDDGRKFLQTSVFLHGMQVEEIRIGGTHTRVVFDKTTNATN